MGCLGQVGQKWKILINLTKLHLTVSQSQLAQEYLGCAWGGVGRFALKNAQCIVHNAQWGCAWNRWKHGITWFT